MNERSLPLFQRLTSFLRGVRSPCSWAAQFHGWPLERGDQRLHLVKQLLADGHRERADHADREQHVPLVVEAEQQRADPVVAGLVHAVAGDHAVGRTLVLDLGHHPLVGLVGAGRAPWRSARPARRPRTRRTTAGRSSRSSVAGVTYTGGLRVRRARRPAAARRSANGRSVRSSSPIASRSNATKLAGVCSAEQLDPAGGRVDALLQRLEVERVALGVGHDHLAVDHRPLREVGQHRRDDLGEVAGHRLLVAAADLDLVAVPEDDRPEAVPLRLVDLAGRDLARRAWRASA